VSQEFTERQSPPVTRTERAVRSLLWRARQWTATLAYHPGLMPGEHPHRTLRIRLHEWMSNLECRWSRRLSQCDHALAPCAVCKQVKAHVINRRADALYDKTENTRTCFGCRTTVWHGEEW
jgi:hypothetical protein